MSDNKPTDIRLILKRSATSPPQVTLPEPEPEPTPTKEPEPTPPTESTIRLERIEPSGAPIKSLGNSGWEVAQLLKEWRLDSIY